MNGASPLPSTSLLNQRSSSQKGTKQHKMLSSPSHQRKYCSVPHQNLAQTSSLWAKSPTDLQEVPLAEHIPIFIFNFTYPRSGPYTAPLVTHSTTQHLCERVWWGGLNAAQQPEKDPQPSPFF